MAVILVQIAKPASRAAGRTQPDVHLIKQVEQVTSSALQGPTWRFAGIPSMRVTDAVEILAFLIWQLLHWLLFYLAAKNSKPARATCLRMGSLAMLPGPNRRFHEPGHMGCRAVALPNSVRLIHNLGNLACCPDFKVSHYQTTTSSRDFPLDRCFFAHIGSKCAAVGGGG
jgi:hypothetical protein